MGKLYLNIMVQYVLEKSSTTTTMHNLCHNLPYGELWLVKGWCGDTFPPTTTRYVASYGTNYAFFCGTRLSRMFLSTHTSCGLQREFFQYGNYMNSTQKLKKEKNYTKTMTPLPRIYTKSKNNKFFFLKPLHWCKRNFPIYTIIDLDR